MTFVPCGKADGQTLKPSRSACFSMPVDTERPITRTQVGRNRAGNGHVKRDGIAILAVVLIIALISLMAIPMMEVARQTNERAITG